MFSYILSLLFLSWLFGLDLVCTTTHFHIFYTAFGEQLLEFVYLVLQMQRSGEISRDSFWDNYRYNYSAGRTWSHSLWFQWI